MGYLQITQPWALRYSPCFPLPWSYKRSSTAEDDTTTFVQQIQELRASSEVLFALWAKALFTLALYPEPMGTGCPRTSNISTTPWRLRRTGAMPAMQNSLAGLSSTESEQNLTFRSTLQKHLNPSVLPGFLLCCVYYSNTTLLNWTGVCLRQPSSPRYPVSIIQMHLREVKYDLAL